MTDCAIVCRVRPNFDRLQLWNNALGPDEPDGFDPYFLVGIVTVVDPLLFVAPDSAGTARLPSSTSLPLTAPSVDRYRFVTLAGADAPPWFRVVSLTLIDDPAPAVAGAVSGRPPRSPSRTRSAC